MVVYECQRCGHKDKLKANMRKHLNRKKPCKEILSNMTQYECLQLLEEGDFVNLSFLKYQLKEKDKQLKEKDKQIHLLQEQLSVLVKTGNGNNNVIGDGNENCNNIIINNNVYIKDFKNTDYVLLKDLVFQCIKDQDPKLKVPAFEDIVEKIHFNNEHPENHNIYKPNVRESRILVFNGEKFVIDTYATEKLLSMLEHALESSVNDSPEHDEIRKKLKHHQALKQVDGAYLKETLKDMEIKLYNGKDIIKDTFRKYKEEKKLLKKQENKLKRLRKKSQINV